MDVHTEVMLQEVCGEGFLLLDLITGGRKDRGGWTGFRIIKLAASLMLTERIASKGKEDTEQRVNM